MGSCLASRKLVVTVLVLLLLAVTVGSIFIWWWLPAPSLKPAFFYSKNGSWLGIRPLVTEVLLPYYEQSQAYSFNGFVRANLTVAVFSLVADPSWDEISLRAGLNAERNASGNTKSIHLHALKFRVHNENDTRASINFGFDRESSRGQNVDLQEMEVTDAWLDKEASANVPVKTETSNNPLNASFGITFRWRLHESVSEKNNPHSLNITGEVYYHEPVAWGLTNTWLISTSIELKLVPGHFLLEWDFGGGGLQGWSAGDSNANSGLDYWEVTTNNIFSPPGAVWCAAKNDGTPGPSLYDNNMDACMKIDLPDFSDFSKAFVYFKAWIETQENHDYLYVEYYDSASNSLKTAATYSGAISTSSPQVNFDRGWLGSHIELPPSATKLQFRFYSDASIIYKGVYLDNIVLLTLPKSQ